MKLEFDLTCPKCKRTMKQRTDDMRPGASQACPGCGSIIKFDGDDGRKVQRALDDVKRSLGNLNIKFRL